MMNREAFEAKNQMAAQVLKAGLPETVTVVVCYVEVEVDALNPQRTNYVNACAVQGNPFHALQAIRSAKHNIENTIFGKL